VVLEVAIGWDLERVILVWFCVVKNSVGGDVARARGWGKYKHLDLMKARSHSGGGRGET